MISRRGRYGLLTLDRYHCLRKLENSLGHLNPLMRKARRAVCQHGLANLTAVLDLSKQQTEALNHRQSNLDRNWTYTTLPEDRGYSSKIRLGSVESTHRAFTYRMKKQGKS